MLADVGRLDPVRSRMLADMGIDVWLLRESVDLLPGQSPGSASTPLVPAPTIDEQPIQNLQDFPDAQHLQQPAVPDSPPVEDSEPLAVTCLVSQSAVMLVDNSEPGISRRLCRDMLATVTGEWSSAPREIQFAWPGGRAQAECWRAFKAFAEKQLSESDVRVVLCSEQLVGRLPELGADGQLLALPGFSELGVDAKRALWLRMQSLNHD